MATFSFRRAALVLCFIAGLFCALIGRVAYLQTYAREGSIARADRQQHQNVVLQARRGEIFDRNGILMAGSVQTRTLFADAKFMADQYQVGGRSIADMDAAVEKLAGLLDKKPYDLSKLLSDRAASRFVKLADNVDERTAEEIEKMDLPGVGVVPANARSYPMGTIGAHLLGGTGGDGKGLDGLELRFNKVLAGQNGFERETKDARRRPIGVAAEDYLPPEHGQHLVLTVDANIQMIAEQELTETCEHFKAPRGEVVVLNPKTGEVLALANYPTFDPASVGDSAPEVRRDSALVAPYEPGSTFKPFIASPAFMWGVTTPTEVWPNDAISWHTPYGRRITDTHYYGRLATWDGLVHSSNVVMSMLGERMGNERIYRAVTGFGFGRPTGIDLPGENAGVVRPLAKWSHFSTDSVSTGYEVMVTPLQLARAFSAIANGGRLVTPRVVMGTLDPSGRILSRSAAPAFEALPRVIDESTATQMRRILCDVVIRGTATGNRSRIWNISGKTGTAHISEGKSGYSLTKFNSSFIACAPAEDPRLVVTFIVHEPDKSIAHYGGTVAAPGARNLIERALTYLDVPSSPDLPPPPADVARVLTDYDEKDYTDRDAGAPKLRKTTPVAAAHARM